MSDYSERELVLMELFCAVLAHAIENDEVFNVSEDIVETIMKSMVESDTLPVLGGPVHEDGRVIFSVKLEPRVNLAEEEDED